MFCKAEECESYLKSLNAQYKEFVVPPPSEDIDHDELDSEDVDEVNNEASEQLEIEEEHQSRRSSIPVRKGQQTIIKNNGTTNPSFEMNEERKAVTSV